MKKGHIYLFVEGNDDYRFFSLTVAPHFRQSYENVSIIEYACMKAVKVDRFIRGIRQMGDSYLLFADIDEEESVSLKISILLRRFHELDRQRTIVIIKEIESWYLAGLRRADSYRLHVKYLPFTDNITKEDFNNVIPFQFHSRISFMIELLKYFSFRTAKRKNRSFHYFIRHFYMSALIFK